MNNGITLYEIDIQFCCVGNLISCLLLNSYYLKNIQSSTIWYMQVVIHSKDTRYRHNRRLRKIHIDLHVIWYVNKNGNIPNNIFNLCSLIIVLSRCYLTLIYILCWLSYFVDHIDWMSLLVYIIIITLCARNWSICVYHFIYCLQHCICYCMFCLYHYILRFHCVCCFISLYIIFNIDLYLDIIREMYMFVHEYDVTSLWWY